MNRIPWHSNAIGEPALDPVDEEDEIGMEAKRAAREEKRIEEWEDEHGSHSH